MNFPRFNSGRMPNDDSRIWPYVVSLLIGLPGNFFVPEPVRADLVKLSNGGELRGKIVATTDSKQRIRLETMTGATVVVERSETQFVTTRPLSIEEYESRVRRIDETWEAHWELADWCRQRGMSAQREAQLRRVTELFPEHEKAQMALGRVWHDGHWVDKDELMTSRGYVKYKNKYITPQELEVIENTADELERERSWFQKVRLWHGWLDGQDANRAQKGLNGFRDIDDPHAAPAIIKFLAPDSRVQVRELAVSILIRISGQKAIAGLVKIALFDEAPDVRVAALDGIGRDHYERAQNSFMKALKNDANAVVCRAAIALGQIGDQRAVSPLIDALVTTHYYQVAMDVPSNQTYSFNTDGSTTPNSPSLPPGLMDAVRTGQLLPPVFAPTEAPLKKMVTVRVEHYNSEVLAALGKLTQQNFGYDKRTWSLWWAAEKNTGGKFNKPTK